MKIILHIVRNPFLSDLRCHFSHCVLIWKVGVCWHNKEWSSLSVLVINKHAHIWEMLVFGIGCCSHQRLHKGEAGWLDSYKLFFLSATWVCWSRCEKSVILVIRGVIIPLLLSASLVTQQTLKPVGQAAFPTRNKQSDVEHNTTFTFCFRFLSSDTFTKWIVFTKERTQKYQIV